MDRLAKLEILNRNGNEEYCFNGALNGKQIDDFITKIIETNAAKYRVIFNKVRFSDKGVSVNLDTIFLKILSAGIEIEFNYRFNRDVVKKDIFCGKNTVFYRLVIEKSIQKYQERTKIFNKNNFNKAKKESMLRKYMESFIIYTSLDVYSEEFNKFGSAHLLTRWKLNDPRSPEFNGNSQNINDMRVYSKVSLHELYPNDSIEFKNSIRAIDTILFELISNYEEHSNGVCIIDLEFSKLTSKNVNDKTEYRDMQLTISNESTEKFCDSTLKLILKNPEEINTGKLREVIDNYQDHQKYFNSKYNEKHYSTLSNFHRGVTTRDNGMDSVSGVSGTGLIEVIGKIKSYKNVVTESVYSYLHSGEEVVFLSRDSLSVKGDYVHYNDEANIQLPPNDDIIGFSNVNYCGTSYSINMIFKGE